VLLNYKLAKLFIGEDCWLTVGLLLVNVKGCSWFDAVDLRCQTVQCSSVLFVDAVTDQGGDGGMSGLLEVCLWHVRLQFPAATVYEAWEVPRWSGGVGPGRKGLCFSVTVLFNLTLKMKLMYVFNCVVCANLFVSSQCRHCLQCTYTHRWWCYIASNTGMCFVKFNVSVFHVSCSNWQRVWMNLVRNGNSILPTVHSMVPRYSLCHLVSSRAMCWCYTVLGLTILPGCIHKLESHGIMHRSWKLVENKANGCLPLFWPIVLVFSLGLVFDLLT